MGEIQVKYEKGGFSRGCFLSVMKGLSGLCPQGSAASPQMENAEEGAGHSLTYPRHSKSLHLQEGMTPDFLSISAGHTFGQGSSRWLQWMKKRLSIKVC